MLEQPTSIGRNLIFFRVPCATGYIFLQLKDIPLHISNFGFDFLSPSRHLNKDYFHFSCFLTRV